MAETLLLLSDLKIVHCDLKPDNILIDMNSSSSSKPFSIKLIDFGSAFKWSEPGQLGMATPEYVPPEFLQVLMKGGKHDRTPSETLGDISNPWSVDVWSLGAILLEIITGVPLWMSLKCRAEINGKSVFKHGLFAVKGRQYDKIYAK